MKKHTLKPCSLLALVLALAMVLALSACGGQNTAGSAGEEQNTNFILDNGEDGVITVTANEAGEGSGGIGYLTLEEGQSMAVETQMEGDSALLLQVGPGDGGDIDNPPLNVASSGEESEYLLEETVSGTNTYSFMLEPGAYSVLVTSVGTSTGTARILPEGEVSQSAVEKGLAAYQSTLDKHPGDYYALADMAKTQDILLLSDSDGVFGDEDKTAVTAAVYCVDKDGTVQSVGEVQSSGTANPLAAADGFLFFGGHKEMYKAHVDTDTCTLVYDEGAEIRYDKEGNASYYTLTASGDWEEDAEGQMFDTLLEEYGNAVPVQFFPVTEGGESAEFSESSLANPMMEVDEAQQLELTGVTLNAPEGAEDVVRTVILMDDPNPIAAVSFTYDDHPFQYRCQSTGELEPVDISGLYFDWTDEQKGEVQGREAIIRTCDEAGCIQWLDVAPGFTYSLSCGGSVDAESLSTVANLVFEELQGDS